MKRLLIIFAVLLIAVPAFSTNPTDGSPNYSFGSVTGGTDNDLDSVDGNVISAMTGSPTADIRYHFGTEGNVVKFSYSCDKTLGSTKTADGFKLVAPANNPGNILWVIDSYPRPVTDYDCSSEFPSGWTYIRDALP